MFLGIALTKKRQKVKARSIWCVTKRWWIESDFVWVSFRSTGRRDLYSQMKAGIRPIVSSGRLRRNEWLFCSNWRGQHASKQRKWCFVKMSNCNVLWRLCQKIRKKIQCLLVMEKSFCGDERQAKRMFSTLVLKKSDASKLVSLTKQSQMMNVIFVWSLSYWCSFRKLIKAADNIGVPSKKWFRILKTEIH